jgi:hypothetical protein
MPVFKADIRGGGGDNAKLGSKPVASEGFVIRFKADWIGYLNN